MPLHLEVLNPEAQALWPNLSELSGGYYLAGGTALALQLNHRRSLDFDFFTPIQTESGKETHIPRTQLAKTEVAFKGHSVSPVINNRDELTLLVGGIKLSFLVYPFPLLLPLLNEQGINLLSASEIAVTKAYTIGRRGEWKDYVDLYACLSQNIITLPEVIQNAQKKYGEGFNDRLLLEQLVYLEDIDDIQGLKTNISITREEMRSYFEKAIANLNLVG